MYVSVYVSLLSKTKSLFSLIVLYMPAIDAKWFGPFDM